ncbi:uncharacterized protein BN783_00529 [Odoribacter sp. CAG:788]|jgi:hypothetical protein|nr:uncharacterized protein BN783_00529 [Odoribacter sp. CAG:788]
MDKKEKQDRVKEIINNAGKTLEAEGVKYFIGVVDKQPESPDGGKVYAKSDISGEEFCYILEAAMPNRKDIINLGLWVGQVLTARDAANKKEKHGKR